MAAAIAGSAAKGAASAEELPGFSDLDCTSFGPDSGSSCQPRKISSEASTDEIYAAIFGAPPPPAPALDYPVELLGMNRGDVRVTPAASPELTMIDRRAIVDLLLPVLTQERQTEILKTFTDRSEISAAELSSLGYTASFDQSDLILTVDIPVQYRSTIPIPLQQRYLTAESAKLIKQATFSGIVNLSAGTSYVHSSSVQETGFNATEANLEAAINFKGLVLETGLRYSESGMSGSSLALADTRLTYDFIDQTIRAEAGDLTVPTSGLQGNPGIGGISAYREFRIKPEENYRANPSQEFELQRDARVSVYINGQFIRDLRLTSGRYNLTDLPLRSGSGNDVVLEIQYDTGEIERVVFTAFYDFDLLKKGASEFAFSAGPRSEISENERHYDTNNIAASGFYRLGVTDRLTVGANGQFDKELYNVGAEATYATGAGVFGTTVAFSDHDLGSGSAATVSYRWNSADASDPLRANVQVRYQDREYRRLGAALSAPFKYDVAARVSGKLTSRTRLQAAAGYREYYSAPHEELSASLSGSYETSSGAFTTTVSYLDDGIKPEWFFGVAYSFRFGRATGQSAYDSRDRTGRASLIYQPDLSADSFGYDLSYTHHPAQQEVRAGIGYTGNRFDGRVEQSFRDGDQGSENITNLFLGSALVFADGHAALSRPVHDSFAIFDTAEGSNDFDLAVDPIGSVFGVHSGYSAYSSAIGPAVLTDLQSYYSRTVAIDAPDAPAGVSVGNEVYSFRPGYRSGYVVEVGSDRNVAIMGRIVGPDGQPVKFAAGYAITPSGERLPVFSNSGGRIYLDGLKSGETVRIEFNTPKGAWIEIVTPKDSVGILRLEEDLVLKFNPQIGRQQIASLATE